MAFPQRGLEELSWGQDPFGRVPWVWVVGLKGGY